MEEGVSCSLEEILDVDTVLFSWITGSEIFGNSWDNSFGFLKISDSLYSIKVLEENGNILSSALLDFGEKGILKVSFQKDNISSFYLVFSHCSCIFTLERRGEQTFFRKDGYIFPKKAFRKIYENAFGKIF